MEPSQDAIRENNISKVLAGAAFPAPTRTDTLDRLRDFWRNDTVRPGEVSVLVLLAVWPWIGLFGHEPWKPYEAYTFGLIYSYLQGKDWLIPVLADSYFLEKPPLFFWAAAASARLFGGVLSLPEAARLVIPLFLYLTLGFLGATSRVLLGHARTWTAPVLLIGALGLFDKVHMLVTDVALLAGLSVGLYGLALGPRRPVVAGLALGGGVAISFMSKGLLGPGMLALTAAVLMVRREGRSMAMIRCLSVAAAIGLPLILVWPGLLYFKSPDLFMQWFWINNFGRYFGFVRLGHRHGIWFYPITLLWFSFPLWPLALAGTAHRIRSRDPHGEITLPLVAFLVMFTVLALATDSRTLYAVPLLLPLALLAAAGLNSFPASVTRRAQRAAIILSATALAGLWLAWFGALLHWPTGLEQSIERFAPDFSMPFDFVFVALAAMGTLFWGQAVLGRSASMATAVRIWSVGVTVFWLLALTLWMPLLDYVKSYRSEINALQGALPSGANCVASVNLGEPVRAMLHYYAGFITRRIEVDPDAVTCDYLIAQIKSSDGNLPATSKWRQIWHGTRPGDEKEALELFRHL
jgi:4-amino-4-deoxy-L-arabinose transferase-like glycosyltransferase